MSQLNFHITLVCFIIFSSTSLQGQCWKMVSTSKLNTDTSAIYKCDAQNLYHSAYGELILLRSGRFIYNSARPLDNHDYSEGFYIFKKDTLILNSDFQNGNLQISLEYSDTAIGGTPDRRLSFARNLKGEQLRTAGYLLNYDTSTRYIYYADFPLSSYPKNLLQEITALKLDVNPGISSSWIPVLRNDKYIIVTVLSPLDLNEYRPKSLTNYRLLKRDNSLVDLEGGL